MSAPSLIARLGLDPADFKKGLLASEEGLKGLQDDAKLTAAQIALLEREMAGGKTDEMVQRHTALQTSLRKTQAESVAAAKQLAALNAVKPTEAAGSGAPDESARYEAYWRKQEELQRSHRAHEAMANTAVSAPAPLLFNPRIKIPGASKQPGGEAEAEGAGGSQRIANMEAGHSVRSIFDSIGAGQDVSRAFQMELPRLLQASGKGLGTMIAVEGFGMAINAINRMVEKAREFKTEMAAAFGGNGGIGTSSINAINKQMDELAGQRDKLMPEGHTDSLGAMVSRWVSNGWAKATGQKTQSEETDDGIVALEQRRIRLSEELADRKAKAVALDERAAVEGEDAVAIDRERLALKERIAAVQDDKNVDAHAQTRLVALLREESALREKHIEQIREQHAAEEEARHGNAQDHANGSDSTLSKAERALKEAEAKRNATTDGTPARRAADDDVTNKAAELRDAQHADAERQAQQAERARLAALTGPQAQQARETLLGQQHDVERQLDPASDTYQSNKEKQSELLARRAEIAGQLRGLDRADTQREFERRREQIAANTGTGAGERLKAAGESLKLNQDEQRDNNAHEQDDDRGAKLNAQAAELLRTKKEIETSEGKAVEHAKAKTTEMELEAEGQNAAAKIAGIRASYEAQIEAALKDQNNELASQLEKQRDIAVEQAKLAEFRKTGTQRAQERLDAQKDQQDLKAMRSREQRQLDNRRQNFEEDHRADLPLDPTARKAMIEKAVPLTVPNRIDDIKAGAENAGKGDGKFSDTNIVAALGKVETAVKGITLRNKK